VCLAVFATCLGTIADVYFRVMALQSDSAHLDGLDLTLSEMMAMDEDGDGKVTEFEFTKFMLLAMGKLDHDMINQIDEEFKKLDADGSGYLDMKDLVGGADDDDLTIDVEKDDQQLLDDEDETSKKSKKSKDKGAVGETSIAAMLFPLLTAVILTVLAFMLAPCPKAQGTTTTTMATESHNVTCLAWPALRPGQARSGKPIAAFSGLSGLALVASSCACHDKDVRYSNHAMQRRVIH